MIPVPTERIQVSLVLGGKHAILTSFVALAKRESADIMRLDSQVTPGLEGVPRTNFCSNIRVKRTNHLHIVTGHNLVHVSMILPYLQHNRPFCPPHPECQAGKSVPP